MDTLGAAGRHAGAGRVVAVWPCGASQDQPATTPSVPAQPAPDLIAARAKAGCGHARSRKMLADLAKERAS